MTHKKPEDTGLFSAVVVIGPTGSGKTAIAHSICDFMRRAGVLSELVNLDAFQFYRGCSVGTAKPSSQEITEYNYHCVDILTVDGSMDAQTYAQLAWNSCATLHNRGGLPLCVGGSGLYLRAFLHGLDEAPPRHEPTRNYLRAFAAERGWPHLHQVLQKADPIRAAELHPNDGVRIERALEMLFLTGVPMSSLRQRTDVLREQSTCFRSFVVRTDLPDNELRTRIVARTEAMLGDGWIAEVRGLREQFGAAALEGFQSFRAIGYRPLLDAIERDSSASDEAVAAQVREQIVTQTWQYARRQRVWNAKERCDALVDPRGGMEQLQDEIVRWWRDN